MDIVNDIIHLVLEQPAPNLAKGRRSSNSIQAGYFGMFSRRIAPEMSQTYFGNNAAIAQGFLD
jgi:hypothetical protein